MGVVKLISRCYKCGYTQTYVPYPPGIIVCGNIICPNCHIPMIDTDERAA